MYCQNSLSLPQSNVTKTVQASGSDKTVLYNPVQLPAVYRLLSGA